MARSLRFLDWTDSRDLHDGVFKAGGQGQPGRSRFDRIGRGEAKSCR
jgi:hypothetical protein